MSFVSVVQNWYKHNRDALMSSTDAFNRLSWFTSTVKESTATTWKSGKLRVERGWQWLLHRQRVVSWVVGIGIAAAAFICFVVIGGTSWYSKNYKAVAPLLTLAAAVAVAGVALARHFAQTNADRQRRITENFSKAIEQLGSDKLEVRLGGIYSLERISKESPDDYWPIMENLTAFVRERSRRSEIERVSQKSEQQISCQDLEQRISLRAYFLWQSAQQPDGKADFFWSLATKLEEIGESPATDIATVLALIGRRSKRSRSRERNPANDWRLDLRRAVLSRAELRNTHLERAIFIFAHLEDADLEGAHLENADLRAAHLEGASLMGAHLEGASLMGAHLEGAWLIGAHLKRANLKGAHLEGAYLVGAHLEEANLRDAHLEGASLTNAHLKRAYLIGAHLEGASLMGAHLEGWLTDAHLEGAHLEGAYLEGANLEGAHLEGAHLEEAHLENATLRHAEGVSESGLRLANGNASTCLPEGVSRPTHWLTGTVVQIS